MSKISSEEKNAPIYDKLAIREEAEKSLEKAAVTEDYPLDLQQACALLNEALASEIVCVLRYRHHQICAKGIHYPSVAAEFAEHAASEEKHMMRLAERIHQLGGNPDLNPATVTQRSGTEYSESTDLMTMIREDLIAERVVISLYRKMIDWFGTGDPTTRRLLEHILQDEEEHADDLANLLESENSRSHLM